MLPLPEFAVIIVAILFSFFVTRMVEYLAPQMGLIQVPNKRSSHIRPTPRGGGIAIALTIVVATIMLALFGANEFWVVAGLTLAIALLGFADDLLNLSPTIRFPLQIVVFSLLVWSGGVLPVISLPLGMELSGMLLVVGVIIAGLWWLNLFNFMDGIDGIAATHAILVLTGMAVIWLCMDNAASQEPFFWLALMTAAATFGFLLRNWPPAKIFMGDAGSNALAVAVFSIALGTVINGTMSYQAWLILTSAFVVDSTVTLIRRSAHGERPWQAHRRHAYQQLSRLWGHKKTTLVYCAWTAIWGFPMAFAAEIWTPFAWSMVGLTYFPLIVFCLWVGAGSIVERGAP